MLRHAREVHLLRSFCALAFLLSLSPSLFSAANRNDTDIVLPLFITTLQSATAGEVFVMSIDKFSEDKFVATY